MGVSKGGVVQCLAHSKCPEICVPATGEERKGQAPGHRQGWGLQPLPQGLAGGGLLPEGPCGSPPNTKEAAAAGLK